MRLILTTVPNDPKPAEVGPGHLPDFVSDGATSGLSHRQRTQPQFILAPVAKITLSGAEALVRGTGLV